MNDGDLQQFQILQFNPQLVQLGGSNPTCNVIIPQGIQDDNSQYQLVINFFVSGTLGDLAINVPYYIIIRANMKRFFQNLQRILLGNLIIENRNTSTQINMTKLLAEGNSFVNTILHKEQTQYKAELDGVVFSGIYPFQLEQGGYFGDELPEIFAIAHQRVDQHAAYANNAGTFNIQGSGAFNFCDIFPHSIFERKIIDQTMPMKIEITLPTLTQLGVQPYGRSGSQAWNQDQSSAGNSASYNPVVTSVTCSLQLQKIYRYSQPGPILSYHEDLYQVNESYFSNAQNFLTVPVNNVFLKINYILIAISDADDNYPLTNWYKSEDKVSVKVNFGSKQLIQYNTVSQLMSHVYKHNCINPDKQKYANSKNFWKNYVMYVPIGIIQNGKDQLFCQVQIQSKDNTQINVVVNYSSRVAYSNASLHWDSYGLYQQQTQTV